MPAVLPVTGATPEGAVGVEPFEPWEPDPEPEEPVEPEDPEAPSEDADGEEESWEWPPRLAKAIAAMRRTTMLTTVIRARRGWAGRRAPPPWPSGIRVLVGGPS